MKTVHKIFQHGIWLSMMLTAFAIQSHAQVLVEKGSKTFTPQTNINNYTPTSVIPSGEPCLLIWVHGLGGSPQSWQTAGTYCQAHYPCYSIYPTYTGNNLYEAGISLGQSIESLALPLEYALGITDHTSGMAIAHSQGGLVTRMLDKQYIDLNYSPEHIHFSRIATFGTPHQGARIINNIDALKQYVANGLVILSKGPILEFMANNWYLNMAISANNLESLLDEFASTFPDQLIPIAMGDFLQEITNSYMEDSPELLDLNNFTSQTPMIAFYGVEDDPVLWRFLYSMVNDINAQGPFNATYDAGFIDDVEINQLNAFMRYKKYQSLADAANSDGNAWWQWLISPVFSGIEYCWDNLLDVDDFLGQGEDTYGNLADAYRDEANWWRTTNEKYEFFIGAKEINSYFHPVHVICRCEYFDQGTEMIEWNFQNIAEPCESENSPTASCETLPIMITNFIERGSDGVVTDESAGTLPVQLNGLSVKLKGSNHEQMKNDNNTYNSLINLFYGNYGLNFTL